MSRIMNSAKNTASGIALRIITLFVHFATRTLFVHYLGNEFLSINGLVSSILSFLSVVELGIGSALVFEMYKPIAENDQEKVRQYLRFYRNIYAVLGGVVFVLGLLLFPIYYVIVSQQVTTVNVVVVYAIYLANSVCSYYFLINRGGFLAATQEDYRLTLSNGITMVATAIGQVISLVVFKNYYFYIAVPLVAMVVQRTCNGIMIGRWYPYIKEKPTGRLTREEKRSVFKNTYGLMIAKISAVINNAVDNIIISSMIGLSTVGYYSNYQTLLTMLSGCTSIVFNAMRPSIGNLNAVETAAKKKEVFDLVNFIGFWVHGFCAICFMVVVQPFVSLWIGEEYIMPMPAVMIFCLNYLTSGLCDCITVFREGCGLYYKGRYRPLVTAALNVIFSMLLGKYYGIVGIVGATIISRMLTLWWYDAYIVFKHVFGLKPIRYLLEYVGKLVIICIVGVFMTASAEFIQAEAMLVQIVVRILLCLIGVNCIFVAIYGRKREFRRLKEIVVRTLFVKIFNK